MKKLSTGEDSTLKNWRMLTCAFFGKDSKAVDFLDDEILSSEKGEDEEVLSDEGQLIRLLHSIHVKGKA